MRTRKLTLVVALAVFCLAQAGCAAGFRAGGHDAGVAAGASVAPPLLPVPVEGSRPAYLPPAPR